MARFLRISAGRAYLVQVPGSSQSLLSDRELAELLNAMVMRFDRGNLPKCFRPYSEREVALTRRPALSDALKVRAGLLKSLEANPPKAASGDAEDDGCTFESRMSAR